VSFGRRYSATGKQQGSDIKNGDMSDKKNNMALHAAVRRCTATFLYTKVSPFIRDNFNPTRSIRAKRQTSMLRITRICLSGCPSRGDGTRVSGIFALTTNL